MLTDRFSLEAMNCPFVSVLNHPYLNFAIMLWTVVKVSLNVVFFLEFVLYAVQRSDLFLVLFGFLLQTGFAKLFIDVQWRFCQFFEGK